MKLVNDKYPNDIQFCHHYMLKLQEKYHKLIEFFFEYFVLKYRISLYFRTLIFPPDIPFKIQQGFLQKERAHTIKQLKCRKSFLFRNIVPQEHCVEVITDKYNFRLNMKEVENMDVIRKSCEENCFFIMEEITEITKFKIIFRCHNK